MEDNPSCQEEFTKFREVLDKANFGTAITDAEGYVEYINDAWAKMHGIESKTAIGKHLSVFHDKKHMPRVDELNQRLLDLGEYSNEEVWHKKEDGSEFITLMSASTLKDSKDKHAHFFASALDITKQKEIEESLRESEKSYRRLSENSPAVVYQFKLSPNGEHSFPYVSESIKECIGISADEVRKDARKFMEKAHPEDKKMFYALIQKSAMTLEKAHLQARFIRNGKTRWVEARSTPEAMPDGSILWDGFFMDITERKETEQALKANKERYRGLFDNMSSGVAVFEAASKGSDFVFKDINNAAEKIESIKAEDVLDKRITEVFPGVKEFGLLDVLKRVWKTGKPECFPVTHYKDNRIAGWRENYVFKLPSGEVVAIYDDLTQTKKEEEERIKLQGQLEQSQKMETIGRLAGGIAHDFNNMLTVIKGQTELALEAVDKHDPIKQNLDEILKSVNSTADLNQQLLAFSRKQTLEQKVVNLNTVITKVKSMLRRLIRKNIEFSIDLDAELMNIRIDPVQIEQVIINLCVNASDAMPSGGKLTIRTENLHIPGDQAVDLDVKPGDFVQLSITDTGFGMSQEVQDKIFEPFYTTKELGKGTGMGLSTAHGVVKQSGGEITVESEPEKGSVFNVMLPAIKAKTSAAKTPSNIQTAKKGVGSILLVEDNPDVQEVAYIALDRKGYNVHRANTGKEALQLCKKASKQYDLVITDIRMPKMDGTELVKKIRKQWPETKVIYMSGYSPEDILEDRETKNAIFLEKPFELRALSEKVEKLLQKK